MNDDLPPLQPGKQLFTTPSGLIVKAEVLWEAGEGEVFITHQTDILLGASGVKIDTQGVHVNGKEMLLVRGIKYNGCIIDAVARECGVKNTTQIPS